MFADAPCIQALRARKLRTRLTVAALTIASGLACADPLTEPGVALIPRDGGQAQLGLLPPGAWQVTTITSLGGSQMRALAINDSGVVAGYGSNAANKTVAFRWRNSTLTTIAMPVLYPSARARAINAAGRIVGDITLQDGQKKGFTSVPGVVASLLPVWAPSADGDHIPYDINDSDVVVGASPGLIPVVWSRVDGVWEIDPSPIINSHYDAISSGGLIAGTEVVPAEAFRAVQNSAVKEELGTLGPGGQETYATDINASGHMVGIATRAGLPPTYFFWSPGSGLVDVGVQAINPIGLDEHIGAISSAGRIVGVNGATLLPFTTHNGVLHTFPLPKGAAFGFAEDVNACGVVTGWVLMNNWSTRAVIWRRFSGRNVLCD